MEPKKLEFCDGVIHVVRDICKLLFNIKTDKELENIFGISNEHFEEVIKKIIDALPDTIFDQATQKLEEMKNIFAREFIFFQVQERCECGNQQYQRDLLQFTTVFSRDIQRRMIERGH